MTHFRSVLPGDAPARRFSWATAMIGVISCGLWAGGPETASGQLPAANPAALSEADLFPDDFRSNTQRPTRSSNPPTVMPTAHQQPTRSHQPRPYPNPREVFANPTASPVRQNQLQQSREPSESAIRQIAYEEAAATGEPMYVGGSPVTGPAPAPAPGPQAVGVAPEQVFAPPGAGHGGYPAGHGVAHGAGPAEWMPGSPVNPQHPFVGQDVFVPDPWEHTNEIHVWDIRAGAVFPVFGGVYSDRLKTGWTLQASGRVLLDWPGQRVVPFVELGGGYVGHRGEDGATSPVGGVLTTTLGGQTIAQTNVSALVDAELKSMQRGFVHLALGSRFAVPGKDDCEAFNITTRAGLRVGHLHARFDETLTPAVLNVINQGRAANPNLGFDAESSIEDTDIFWGLLAGVGVSSPYRSVWLHGCWVGDMSYGVECDYVHDFFDLGGFDDGSDGLGSVNLLATWTVRR